MLVDVDNFNNDPVIAAIASMMRSGGPSKPQRISKGMYLAGHWNVGDLVPNVRKRYLEDGPFVELPVPECGVCDSPDQFSELFDLDSFPEPVFVSFVRISKADQPSSGGWRWRKWGDYVGKHSPQYEYLYDEKDIDCVYTFSVHELRSFP